ncbi:hypothetical protein ACVFYP_19305 [Roseomonas sp. F4]
MPRAADRQGLLHRQARDIVSIMARWVELADAEAHPLYGFRGWLRLPSLLAAVILLSAPIMFVRDWFIPIWLGRTTGHDASLQDLYVLAVGLVTAILWFRRWRGFRIFYGLSAAADLVLSLARLPPSGDPMRTEEIAFLITGMAFELAFLLAIHRSQRFRITFEHRLRADEASLTPPPASHSPAPPPAPSY